MNFRDEKYFWEINVNMKKFSFKNIFQKVQFLSEKNWCMPILATFVEQFIRKRTFFCEKKTINFFIEQMVSYVTLKRDVQVTFYV